MPEGLLTVDQLALIQAATREAMAETGHVCHFSEGQRKKMHSWNDIVDQEKADHSTFTILIQSGNAVRNITKRIITLGVSLIVVVILAVVGGFIFGKGLH